MNEGSALRTEVDIAIIGSGFGGLGAAIRLRRAGFDDLVVLERAHDVGGTWRDNTYPGCACDVQSHLYSFSFAPNPGWSHSYSPQPEIQAYLQRVARDSGVLPLVRFGTNVEACSWDAGAQRWRLGTTHGAMTARVVVMATGPLSDPVIPALPGLDSFGGRAFHSAQWEHDVDLAGKRVAVVGTGASAIQFVPAIQPRVARLFLFQRTAPWVLPRLGHRIGRVRRTLYRAFPPAQRLVRGAIWAGREAMVVLFRHPALMRRAHRVALAHLEHAVPDPALRAKLTPDFTLGCKRVLLSNEYLPALAQPNVDVVTAGIAEVRPSSVVTTDGIERPVDAIIFGTGFRPTDPPLAATTRGIDGRTLSETWAGSPRAHLGITVPGFPNLFMLLGPNSGLGHSSVVYMIEAQVAHLLGALRHMRDAKVAAIAPTAASLAAWTADVERRMRGTVWVDGGCRSWYLDATGHNTTLWPDFTWRYRRRAARFDVREYEAVAAAAPARQEAFAS